MPRRYGFAPVLPRLLRSRYGLPQGSLYIRLTHKPLSLDINMSMSKQVDLLLEEEEMLLTAACLQLQIVQKPKRTRKKRLIWMRSWLQRRVFLGHYEKLVAELSGEDLRGFRNYMRISPELFQELLERVGPRLMKKDTFMRKALEPGHRLAIALRYMASGDSYMSLSYNYRVAPNTISDLVPVTCDAIIQEYLEEVMTCPSTPEEWKQVAQVFSDKWNFHHTCGAIDGKHVAIKCPANGGTLYFNYKKFYSIVLMALVDANYRFLYVSLGANGSASDGGVFKECSLGEALEQGYAGLPCPEPLPGDDKDIPYALVGDDAFGLRTWLMKT